MAEEEKKNNVPPQGPPMVQIPQADLSKIMETLAENERKIAEMEINQAGFAEQVSKAGTDEPKLREKTSREPKFRTVRMRKYPMKGDFDKQEFIVGWSNRGAYQMVDKSGITPVIVDMLDIQFLGHERNPDGKLAFEAVPLLSLLNKGVQVHCKIVDVKTEPRKEPTGEEIDISVYDPQHGMTSTGEKIDGYVAYSDITYTIQIPGKTDTIQVDGKFVNA